MLQFIYSQFIFYISIASILFLPGWFLLLAIFGKSKILSDLERFVISFGLGMIVVDFIAFLYNKINIPINPVYSIAGVIVFSAICFAIYKFRKTSTPDNLEENNLFSFSKNQFILILLLLFLTIFIKTAYLSGSVAPTATDMGHHTYWIKVIAESHKLTDYEGMPDFIIGEHIAMAEIYQITGASIFSGFPVVFLYLINLLGILAVFILTLRIFKNKTIAIFTLLFLGVLFAVTSPQAKFVSGGVMGNIIGNYLTPLAFYFYYRAFEFLNENRENNALAAKPPDSKAFLSLAIFLTFGLFYTHHLTAFIFLFVFVLLIFLFLAINYKEIKNILSSVWRIVWSPWVIATFIGGLIFFFLIFTPTYIKGGAVNTAVGAPSKASREGLTLDNLKSTVGEARAALGFLGLLLLALYYRSRKKDFGIAIVAAWTIMIFIMSVFPHLLLVNLPSDRIGNYLSYPLAILSAFGFYSLFKSEALIRMSGILSAGSSRDSGVKNLISLTIFKSVFIVFLVFAATEGLSDSAQAFKKAPDFTPMNEAFSASKYLAANVFASDIVLKDHNYITADAWIKSFFMRGYKYPLSRGYFQRYEDPTKPREMCTLWMISNPDSDDAKNCFSETRTDFVMINPVYDSSQFKKLDNFNEVYATDGVAVFFKK